MKTYLPIPGTTKPGLNYRNIIKAALVALITGWTWGIFVRLAEIPALAAAVIGIVLGYTASRICLARWEFFRVPMTPQEIEAQQKLVQILQEQYGSQRFKK